MTQECMETLGSAVRRHATLAPRHPAARIGEDMVSYAELDRAASRISAALRREGIARGGIVAVLAEASVRYVALMIGAARANVVLVPLPVSTASAGLAGMIADAAPKRIFTDCPGLLPPGLAPELVVDLDVSAFERWLPAAAKDEPQAPVMPEDPATIIYSSGTTGSPKGIVQSHRSRSALISNAVDRGYSADSVTLLATPLYSNTTLAALYQTIGAGGTTVLMDKFDAGGWLRLAERWGATHTMLVPVMYQRLLDHPDFATTDLSSFRAKYCAASPFSAALKRRVLDCWPGGLTEIYGLTESGALFTLRAHERPDKLHTVGQAAPGCGIRILDDHERDVPTGAQGEIVSRSPGMMLGYHNQPAATAAIRWTAPDGTLWQRSGDIGRLDDEGFLTIVDRKKDIIISGGHNIYPSDLEAQLIGHPDVADASVVGVPSAVWGETPVAFVVAPHAVSTARIKEWVNARLGRTQRLADVVLIDALPRGPIGKVLKNELRDRYLRDQAPPT